jgi:protocatechuate 3,4-dioxygenase, beta subunit
MKKVFILFAAIMSATVIPFELFAQDICKDRAREAHSSYREEAYANGDLEGDKENVGIVNTDSNISYDAKKDSTKDLRLRTDYNNYSCDDRNRKKEKIIDECLVTPAIWELKMIPYIVPNNNLRRLTGSPEFAKGNLIVVEGTVRDSNCVPINDAIVEIWQANAKGGIDYTSDYNSSDIKSDSESKDKADVNFAGSGSVITDNMGRYSFITVFPGVIDERSAPHINFRLRHKDFLPMETVMYFENSNLNDRDTTLLKEVDVKNKKLLVAKAKKYTMNMSEGYIKYNFDITLEGNNKYKKY